MQKSVSKIELKQRSYYTDKIYLTPIEYSFLKFYWKSYFHETSLSLMSLKMFKLRIIIVIKKLKNKKFFNHYYMKKKVSQFYLINFFALMCCPLKYSI